MTLDANMADIPPVARKTWRVGLIGCGRRGRSTLATACELPGLVAHAFADRDAEAAEQARAEFNGAYATTDLDRVLADDAVDIVAIATYGNSHARLAIAALDAGKHVYCEKPLGLSIEECLAVEDAVGRSGRKLIVGMWFRYTDTVQATRRLIPRPIMSLGKLCQDPLPDEHFTVDPSIDGGPILSTACHAIDLLCHLHGAEPVEVSAVGLSLQHAKWGVIDNVSAGIRFANDTLASFMQTEGGKPDFSSKWYFEIFDGTRCVSIHNHLRSAQFTNVPDAERLVHADDRPGHEPTRGLWASFIQAIERDVEPSPGVRDGTRALRIIRAIEESARTGVPVHLD